MDWQASAERQPGTWWEDWALWVAAHAGAFTTPPDLPPGEPAPGHYVRNEVAPPFEAAAPKGPSTPAVPPARRRAPRGPRSTGAKR